MHKADDITATATQRLTDFLASRRMRKTPERYAILRSACRIHGMFTIDQLDEQIRQDGEMLVSRTTLFNNLETLVEAQVLIKHTLARAAHYEVNLTPSPKAYMVCDRCRKVAKLERKELEAYLAAVRSKSFVVRQPILYLHGLCRKCYMEQIRKVKQTNIRQFHD